MSPLGKDPLLTLWAIPKKEEVPLILNAKQTIDNKLKGPNFPIHMTLSGKIDLNKADEKDLEEKVVSNFSPFEVFFKGYGICLLYTSDAADE